MDKIIAANDPIYDFRDELFRQTVKWCVERSPFYRARFGEIAKDCRGLVDLPRLPILFRQDVVRHQQELLCQHYLPSCVQYTTGTTGEFLQLFRGHEEIEFIWNFFAPQWKERSASTELQALYLSLTSAYHGSPTPIPGGAYVISAGVYDRTQAKQARAILEHEYSLPGVESRISAIVGGDILVKALTAFLISDKFDLRGSPVKLLGITGGYMSAARKRHLSELWGATVSDRFSMSEIFGGARECGIGGHWIFDTEVIPEVVHPRTLATVESGLGALVLTGLYPFMQMMPLVRYYTGDLVEIVDTPKGGAVDILVRFMGRQRRSIIDDSSAELVPIILAGPLYEILEALPDIASTGRFDLGAGENLEFAGKLHYDLEWDTTAGGKVDQITLRLGLRYEPWIFRERTAQVVTEVRQKLYAAFPELRNRVETGSLAFLVKTEHGRNVAPYSSK